MTRAASNDCPKEDTWAPVLVSRQKATQALTFGLGYPCRACAIGDLCLKRTFSARDGGGARYICVGWYTEKYVPVPCEALVHQEGVILHGPQYGGMVIHGEHST